MPALWALFLHEQVFHLLHLSVCFLFIYLFIYLRFYLFLGEGEKHQCVVASHVSPCGDLACNPGMYPDWESNWPIASQVCAQSTELHQPGHVCVFLDLCFQNFLFTYCSFWCK